MPRRQAQNRVALKRYEYYPDPSGNTVSEDYYPTPRDYKMMNLAIKMARRAIGKDSPVGAVATIPGPGQPKTWKSHAMDNITGDPRKHAEDVILDEIIKSKEEQGDHSPLDLSNFIIYTTAIPCIRCAAVLSDCHAGMIFYGAEREETDIMRARKVDAHNIWSDAGRRLTVVAGLLAVEASELLVETNRALK